LAQAEEHWRGHPAGFHQGPVAPVITPRTRASVDA
jgi:hypothetical protein